MRYWTLIALIYCGAVSAQPLSLADALRSGDAQSPRLAAQRQALVAAAEQGRRASELPDPRLRLGIENLPISGDDRFRYGREPMTMGVIGVMQEFPNAAKRAARGERAEQARAVEQATLVSQRAILHRDIAAAWLDAYFAQRARGALERLVSATSTQSELASTALSRGRQSAAESLMLRSAFEQARERVFDQDRLAARARFALAVLIGDEAKRPLGAGPDLDHLDPPREMLLKRLDEHAHLRVLDMRESLARAEIDLARASRKSDWGLEVSYGQRAPYFDNMLTVMVSMDLPWQRAQRQDRDVAARVAELEQARAVREEARRVHEAEMRGYLADYDAASSRIDRYRNVLLPLARERYEVALAGYRGGRGELNAVLDASRGIADTELALVGIEAERAKAWAGLTYLYTDEQEHEAHRTKVPQ
jgi:outer membrane protein, heavy metal efflux system